MAVHNLDENTKTALALLCGYNQEARYTFTPSRYMAKDDKKNLFIPETLWPRFTLRPYTVEEKARRRRQMIDAALDIHKVKADDVVSLIDTVLVSWENVITPDGDVLEKKPGAIGRLADMVIADLLAKADEISGLTVADRLGFGY